MLIGHDDRPADWYAFMLPPIVPPASAYVEGVRCLLFRGERHFPQAKSLSMLLSTVAYRTASARGCYDALLVNGKGGITEGTRTNLFYVRHGESGVVYTPPAAEVLEGITRRTLIEALAAVGTRTIERPLGLAEALEGACGLMVTSTSSRVIPVQAIVGAAGASAAPVPLSGAGGEREDMALDLGLAPETGRIRAVYDAYLDRYAKG
jgi:branched-subunit amino acid aminotransferase/4-amino-4-deoxychorismate lyase